AERVDEMVEHILTAMFAVGLFEHPPTADGSADVSTGEHLALAEELSTAATVLLENRNGALPIGPEVHSIAIIGHDAGPGTQVQEGGSSAVLPSADVVTPLEAITARSGAGVQVTYAPGTLGVIPLPLVPSDVLTATPGPGAGLSGT